MECSIFQATVNNQVSTTHLSDMKSHFHWLCHRRRLSDICDLWDPTIPIWYCCGWAIMRVTKPTNTLMMHSVTPARQVEVLPCCVAPTNSKWRNGRVRVVDVREVFLRILQTAGIRSKWTTYPRDLVSHTSF